MGSANWAFPWCASRSRQAYQALKSLATHKIDRNDARGLAHLARTGFFKPVHVKSLQKPCAPLIDQRAQEAGRPAGDLGKSDPWSCGRVPVRLPRALAANAVDDCQGAEREDRRNILPPCAV